MDEATPTLQIELGGEKKKSVMQESSWGQIVGYHAALPLTVAHIILVSEHQKANMSQKSLQH